MPTVARINIFPVKSCDGVSVASTVVLAGGALQHDRQFALIDGKQEFINAKRTAAIHRLKLDVDPARRTFVVSQRGQQDEFRGHLDEQAAQLSDWLTRYFGIDVSIVENTDTGFPDDLGSPGPTIISTATLQTVADWFPGLSIDEVRRRFRANIEVEGVEPFWEDRLYRADQTPQPFHTGSVLFAGTNPCQRCVVPTRHPETGEIRWTAFAHQFARQRAQNLPPWAARERFDHFYRLSTNTKLLDHGSGVISIGDFVRIEAN
jgi:uncharacterized protein YcbX